MCEQLTETIGNAISAFLFGLGFLALNHHLSSSSLGESNVSKSQYERNSSSVSVATAFLDGDEKMELDAVVNAAETIEESYKSLDDLKENVPALLRCIFHSFKNCNLLSITVADSFRRCLPRENLKNRLNFKGDAVADLLDSAHKLLKSCERICFRPKSFAQALGVLDAARVLLSHLPFALDDAIAKAGYQDPETRKKVEAVAHQLLLSVGKAQGYSKNISSATLILLASGFQPVLLEIVSLMITPLILLINRN